MQLPPAVQTSNNTARLGRSTVALQSNPHLTQARGIDQKVITLELIGLVIQIRYQNFTSLMLLTQDPNWKLFQCQEISAILIVKAQIKKRRPTVIRWFIHIKHIQTYQSGSAVSLHVNVKTSLEQKHTWMPN